MSSVLFVTIPPDALPLACDQTSVGPTAGFALPLFFNCARDVPPAIAHVSEDITSRPYRNETPHLKAVGCPQKKCWKEMMREQLRNRLAELWAEFENGR